MSVGAGGGTCARAAPLAAAAPRRAAPRKAKARQNTRQVSHLQVVRKLGTAGVARVHGDEDAAGRDEPDSLRVELEHALPLLDGEHHHADLRRHHAQNLYLDTIELVEARPRPCLRESGEHLGKGGGGFVVSYGTTARGATRRGAARRSALPCARAFALRACAAWRQHARRGGMRAFAAAGAGGRARRSAALTQCLPSPSSLFDGGMGGVTSVMARPRASRRGAARRASYHEVHAI